ncbi:WYL domain-containing protein [Priestia megaterium]|uniref:WYL domain-containing protein n=1 Tax=Priestia megaterium TaxID=1404 RepID=UPI00115566E7|nr:WYL domain-containing protein [Priestia megaterium]
MNGAANKRLIAIRYRDKDNQLSVRKVEPYELRDGKLFAYDPEKGGIRAFFTQNIEAALATTDDFEPRFPIKINSSIMSDGSL